MHVVIKRGKKLKSMTYKPQEQHKSPMYCGEKVVSQGGGLIESGSSLTLNSVTTEISSSNILPIVWKFQNLIHMLFYHAFNQLYFKIYSTLLLLFYHQSNVHQHKNSVQKP